MDLAIEIMLAPTSACAAGAFDGSIDGFLAGTDYSRIPFSGPVARHRLFLRPTLFILHLLSLLFLPPAAPSSDQSSGGRIVLCSTIRPFHKVSLRPHQIEDQGLVSVHVPIFCLEDTSTKSVHCDFMKDGGAEMDPVDTSL
ncbi:unnamed protein product [Victoria cruziana]